MKKWIIAIGALSLMHCGTPVIGTIEGDAGVDAPIVADVVIPPIEAGDASGLSCSNDLRQVIDEDGGVAQTCPPDQGCKGGVCVAACTAAGASQGSLGCDFVVSTPAPAFQVVRQPCFVAFVTNNWTADAPIHVSWNGTTFDASTFGRIADVGVAETSWAPVPSTGVPPGKVAVLYLSDDPDATWTIPTTCPIAPAVRATYGTSVGTPGDKCSGDPCSITGRGKAFHITTDMPVTTYSMQEYTRYGAADDSGYSSASLIFPSTSWGTNYFAFMPGPKNGMPTAQVVASQDNTTITVLPSIDLPLGPGVAAAKKNVVATYTLNAGDIIQWQPLPTTTSWPYPEDMSGTIIQANAPIAFVSGTRIIDPTSKTWPISAVTSADHKQLPAIGQWASEYAIEPYATRKPDLTPESALYRVQAAVDGTMLTFDPPISGAPTLLLAGQVADFETESAFVVTSQDDAHPFYIEQTMTGLSGYWDTNLDAFVNSRPGCSAGSLQKYNGQCALGSFESVNVPPPAQFLGKYVFFVDPGFATSNLVFVRKKTTLGFRDVTLDCAGVLTGWMPIGTSGQYEGMNLDLVRATIPIGSCNAGPHTASSVAPFGVTVWGLGEINTYGYPAGGNAAVINKVIVPPVPK